MGLPSNRESRHVNFFKSKIGELRYYLEAMVQVSDDSLALMNMGQDGTQQGKVIVYSFSSFTNALQSIKDSGALFLPLHSLSWGKIKTLRHGEFMKDARNAITHDGNPIINFWLDGHYYVGGKIERLDENKKPITIVPPKISVREFSLEFAHDLAVLISDILKLVPDDDKLKLSTLSMDEWVEGMKSELVPEFAKELFTKEYDINRAKIAAIRIPHVEEAIALADSLATYCKERLAPSL